MRVEKSSFGGLGAGAALVTLALAGCAGVPTDANARRQPTALPVAPPANEESAPAALSEVVAPETDVACAETDEAAPAPATKNVVLVTVDGVRFQEIFGGTDARLAAKAHLAPARVLDARSLLPNLHARFFDGGTVLGDEEGAIRASGPNYISLPGYLEIVRGSGPYDCDDNACPVPPGRSFLDELRADDGVRAGDVAVFASWERIAAVASTEPVVESSRDRARVLVSAGRSWSGARAIAAGDAELRDLFDRGASAKPFPGHGDYRPDRLTAPLALRYLATRRPRFLWLALGDPDEWAHRGDYGGYLGSLRRTDEILGELFATLDDLGAYGAETSVLFTTDHGRGPLWQLHGRDELSSRVWLMAAGGAIPARGTVPVAAPRHLADIASTIRALLALPQPVGARHPIDELLPSAGAPVTTLAER